MPTVELNPDSTPKKLVHEPLHYRNSHLREAYNKNKFHPTRSILSKTTSSIPSHSNLTFFSSLPPCLSRYSATTFAS
uniref:Uncharacterized protein n=1 Tax=Arion vulgaris TaxID=1028688 RepID=A0A0B6ZF15_9EUPU